MTERPITFPKTGENTWTNHETGVQIVKLSRFYQVRMPMLNPVGWQHAAYRRTLTKARSVAISFVAIKARPGMASAYAEALTEHIDRAEQGVRP